MIGKEEWKVATNKIDYDTLEQASGTYSNQAAAIADVLTKLNSMNATLVEGWQNETARAFIDRYEREHKKALEAARDSLNDISNYITKYRTNEIERDATGANSIRG